MLSERPLGTTVLKGFWTAVGGSQPVHKVEERELLNTFSVHEDEDYNWVRED